MEDKTSGAALPNHLLDQNAWRQAEALNKHAQLTRSIVIDDSIAMDLDTFQLFSIQRIHQLLQWVWTSQSLLRL